MDRETEEKLVESAKSNRDDFGKLYDLYYKRIYNYLYKKCGNIHLAQDLTADTFFSVLKNIKAFKWKHEYSFMAWIYKIATNTYNQYFRNKKNYQFIPSTDIAIFYNNAIDSNEVEEIEKQLDEYQEFNKVRKIIENLPLKYQNVIHLKFFEEKSYDEIAYITGENVNTLKSHLKRALAKINEELMQPNNKKRISIINK